MKINKHQEIPKRLLIHIDKEINSYSQKKCSACNSVISKDFFHKVPKHFGGIT